MNSQMICFSVEIFEICNSSEKKKKLFDYSNIKENGVCQNHHIITGARILPFDKLSSKEICSILIQNIAN